MTSNILSCLPALDRKLSLNRQLLNPPFAPAIPLSCRPTLCVCIFQKETRKISLNYCCASGCYELCVNVQQLCVVIIKINKKVIKERPPS